jgi:hypothetical protein
VLDTVTRNINYRRARREFIERGIASGAAAELSGKCITAERMLAKLSCRLDSARKRAGGSLSA